MLLIGGGREVGREERRGKGGKKGSGREKGRQKGREKGRQKGREGGRDSKEGAYPGKSKKYNLSASFRKPIFPKRSYKVLIGN